MSKKNKNHPSKDAFLTNPVASVNEATGYVNTAVQTNYEANNLSKIQGNIPTTPLSKKDRAKTKSKSK